MQASVPSPQNELFTSWKEIASYLNKGVRTVQRWEAEFGLPVRRPREKPRGVVQAKRVDLDCWIDSTWAQRVKRVASSNVEGLQRCHGLRLRDQVDGNGGTHSVNLRVTPFRTPVQEKASFLIAFETPAGNVVLNSDSVPYPLSEDERTIKDEQIAQLKQELAATKEYLQSIIGALKSMNGELQSSNEEIRSGNVELQSTEMQHRYKLLTQLNNDLTNLLNSVNLPMVMVGPDLSVRRFTPPAAKVLGLTATDVGRPITRLKLKIDVANLEELMLGVIDDVRPRQFRGRTEEGEWCDVRLTPYRTSDNRIDGVVLNILGLDAKGDGADPTARPRASSSKKNAKQRTTKRRK